MTAPMTPAKQKAWRLGQFAETLAVWQLRAKGYRILTRRFRCRPGEIDIIARRGNVLVFVEVKARRNAATAAESISSRQISRIPPWPPWTSVSTLFSSVPGGGPCILWTLGVRDIRIAILGTLPLLWRGRP